MADDGCRVCGKVTPIMVTIKVPGTYAEYHRYCWPCWQART